MLVSEEHAKGMVCPFMVRKLPAPGGGSIEERCCLGSWCMAWTWEQRETEESWRARASNSTYPGPRAVYERTGLGSCGAARP